MIRFLVNLCQGPFVYGTKEGFGRWFCPDGEVYEGEFKHDKQNGRARRRGRMALDSKVSICGLSSMNVLIGLMRIDMYKGSFVDNKMEGFGIYVGPHGEEYEGEWEDDKPNGKGKKTWLNGATYEGECWAVQSMKACT